MKGVRIKIAKYIKKPLIVDAVPFEMGIEDCFKYHIPMFGVFTKQECIEAGFTPDFEEDKIPFINTLEGEYAVAEGKHFIVTGIEGERYPVEVEIFHKLYDLYEE